MPGTSSPGRAHPRLCGEHTGHHKFPVFFAGSSPPVRGARERRRPQNRSLRLIPACAGSTVRGRGVAHLTGAHPRLCGEHPARGCSGGSVWGSSPPVRGAHEWTSSSGRPGGLIPACAGSTQSTPGVRAAARAHPRLCGEHAIIEAGVLEPGGSSPPVRGALCGRFAPPGLPGLIPACAGSTRGDTKGPTHLWAHPRLCGEHFGVAYEGARAVGSSPPVRGAHVTGSARAPLHGLIPACAGSTLADMGFYPLYRQNRITLEPEPASRIHDKQLLLTPTSTAIPTRLTPPRLRYNFTNHRTIN